MNRSRERTIIEFNQDVKKGDGLVTNCIGKLDRGVETVSKLDKIWSSNSEREDMIRQPSILQLKYSGICPS